jgi:hypothetical protein
MDMKKRTIRGFIVLGLGLIVVLGLAGSTARAADEMFAPSDPDMGDLDHNKYYTWGIDVTWDTSTETVDAATLLLNWIWNFDWNSNDLWIHLLDDAPLGITDGNDYQDGVDQFDSQGILLVHYEDLTPIPKDLAYDLSDDQIATLNAYAADGRFALAFDPDCHFYNRSIEFELKTGPVPEPATMLIVGAGALLVLARKKKNA